MIKSYRAVIGEYNLADKVIRREDTPRTRKLMDREIMSKIEQEELGDLLEEEFKDIADNRIKKRTIH